MQYKGYSITGSVMVVDDIKDHMPFNRPLHCTRCAEVKKANLLLPLLSKVSWGDLKTCDVPSDVPFEVKGVATSLKSMIVNRSDNSSSKAFTRVLLEFIKTYSFCVPHATHCDVLSPKSESDIGAFQIHICQQQKIPQPL